MNVKNKDIVRNRYNEFYSATEINRLEASYFREKYYISEFIKNHKCRIIGDLGCGDGKLQNILNTHIVKNNIYDKNIKIIGTDLAFNALTKNPRRSTINADLTALPFKKHSFDLCYSLSTFQYLDNISDIFIECNRILKPGGLLIFTIPTKYSLFALDRYISIQCGLYKFCPNFKLYSSIDIEAELKKYNFKVAFSTAINAFYFYELVYRIFALLRNKIKVFISKSNHKTNTESTLSNLKNVKNGSMALSISKLLFTIERLMIPRFYLKIFGHHLLYAAYKND